MLSSLQERVHLFLQKAPREKASLQEGVSTDFSTQSLPARNVTRKSPSKSKRKSTSVKFLAKDAFNVFGDCFPRSHREADRALPSKDFSVSSVSTDRSLLHSFASYGERTYGVDQSPSRKEIGAIVFKMSELKKATGNFSPSNKIGQGGFGAVYKGRLKDGRIVAIKRAKMNQYARQLSIEFRNEVATLSNVDHLNLVKLIGYVEEENERILVVEYVANGNLRQHLDVQLGSVLDLTTRLDIAIDIAHALTYLHLYNDRSIIHRDVKSSNILLTENFRAKVADFGFSRVGPLGGDATHVSTQIKGTAGYLDPEYLRTYQLTQKSDVYSFGVLLVEIVSGRKPIEQNRLLRERITSKWAFQMFLEGKALDILDPNLQRTPAATFIVEKLLMLAFQCSSPSKQDRPTMKKAAEILWEIRKDYRILLQSHSTNSQRDGERISEFSRKSNNNRHQNSLSSNA